MSPGKNWSYRRLFVTIVSTPVLPIYAPFRMTTSTSRSLLAFFHNAHTAIFFIIEKESLCQLEWQSLSRVWQSAGSKGQLGHFVLCDAFGNMVTVHTCSFGPLGKAYCHGLFWKKHVYNWHRLENVFQYHTFKWFWRPVHHKISFL